MGQQFVPEGLLPFLVRQSARGTQRRLAKELDTDPARVSRIANGKAPMPVDQFLAVAPALALGTRGADEHPAPLWVVARLRASGWIDRPPVTPEDRLPVFVNYRDAEHAVSYLQLFPGTEHVVAVPVYRSYLAEQLDERGLAAAALLLLDVGSSEEVAEEFEATLGHLRRSFADARSATGPAGYGS